VSRKPEILHYKATRTKYCRLRDLDPCADHWKRACEVTDTLITKLKRGRPGPIAEAKDAVADTMRALDKCRVQHGARLSLYGRKS
jgi:hypothetical protein